VGGHHQPQGVPVGCQPGHVGVDAVEGEGDRYDERGVSEQPAVHVGGDGGREPAFCNTVLRCWVQLVVAPVGSPRIVCC